MYRNKMNLSVAVLLATSLAFIVSCEAATHGIPPLFGENPSARIVDGKIVASGAARAVLDYRLPNTTEPVHYDVEVTTNVHNGTTAFNGTVKIQINVNEDTRIIVLHARQLSNFTATISNASVTGGQVQALNISYEEEREFLSLTPTNQSLTFNKGSSWLLTIAYQGELRTDNGGFYLSTYDDDNGTERYIATTQFESTDARHAFPCYDEPAKRATFSIVINHDPSYNAISNMPLDEEASRPGYSVFQKTVNMPTYLVAFIVSDFEYSEGVLYSRPQRVYTRPGTVSGQEFGLVSGLLLLQRLIEYYDVDFALPKMYQVGVPDFAAGAMENWGLVTYREEYIIYNKNTSTTSTQTNIATIIAHEYCHQWFGNLVAIKWWTYLWLKEGFATLFSWQATDAAYPEWDIYQLFLTDDYQRALTADGTGLMNPMSHYVQTPSEISSRYDSISYSKAGSVLYMWQCALGDEVFRQGLNLYLTENQYSAADEWQLFEALSIAAGAQNVPLPATMANMFSSWSQQSSYPLLTVTRHYENNSFTITQEAFYDNSTTTSNQTWYIPINYAHKSNPDHRNTTASHYLLKTKEIHITDNNLAADDWLLLNKQSTGFYRINYDERNWNLIIDALKSNPYRFHPRNRGQLIHDVYKFSSTGRLDQSTLFNLLQYLPNEDQFAPWSTTYSVINTLNRYLNGDSDYKNFQSFVASLVSDLFDKLGVNDATGEQHLVKSIRSIAINLACLSGIESCLEETNNKLRALIEDGIAIEPNLQSQIYCNGLRQSDDTVFDFVFNQVLQSNNQAFRRTHITSLGCSQSESQLRKFVNSSIDTSADWRTQERITLLSAAYSSSSTGLLVSIDFLSDNWEAYSNLNPGFGGDNPLNTAVVAMSSYVVNEEQRQKYLDLVDKVKDSDKVQSNLETVVNTNIRSNFEWLTRNRDPIMQWVNNFTRSGSATLSASLLTVFTTLTVALARYL
ncbi:aminopeptidase N-like [Rhagoletis pomonella]|uniref:aminopeptidase N-like n=1 Tax=Rhagoletis pomonella TaxID=28610 RepID=UPI00177DD378|nr:aminopeptidase N-like [Rhagoletis pomonella]XP_036342061.1 aminopeptidase N-like [Rhagoletis pomonella]